MTQLVALCTMLTAVLVAGLRSKYGLNNHSAVQVIEDALSTGPETDLQPVAATSPKHHSQTDFAPNFSPEQAQPLPQRHNHAPSQAIVPSGGYNLPAALLQTHTLLPQCHIPNSSGNAHCIRSWRSTTGGNDCGMDSGHSVEAWSGLSQRLKDNGFAGLPMLSEGLAARQSPERPRGTSRPHGPQPPSHEALYTALDSVLTQYERRAHLVQELLSATDMARERESHVDDLIKNLRR